MSDPPKKPPPLPPRKTVSGEHPAVVGFRAKLQSIAEHQMPDLVNLNERLDRLQAKVSAAPPPMSAEDIEIVEMDVILVEDEEEPPSTQPDPHKDTP